MARTTRIQERRSQVIHKIIPGLIELATPIELIRNLENNPHNADVKVHMALLKEFGQHRVLIAKGDPENGGYAVVGNHMLEAARRLEWTHIAVAWTDEDDDRAMARAISDNRAAEFGRDDPIKIAQIVPEIAYTAPEAFGVLGWDDFELASMQEIMPPVLEGTGYVAPDQVSSSRNAESSPEPTKRSDEDMIANGGGATDNKRDAVIQFTLVFDDSAQRDKWTKFIKWLRGDPGIDGETTAARLIDFIDQRVDYESS
jgi:hypothetical protein